MHVRPPGTTYSSSDSSRSSAEISGTSQSSPQAPASAGADAFARRHDIADACFNAEIRRWRACTIVRCFSSTLNYELAMLQALNHDHYYCVL